MGKVDIILVELGDCSVSCIEDWIYGGHFILSRALGAMLRTKAPMERPRPQFNFLENLFAMEHRCLAPQREPGLCHKRQRRKPLAPMDDTSYGERIPTTPLTAEYRLQVCSSGEKRWK